MFLAALNTTTIISTFHLYKVNLRKCFIYLLHLYAADLTVEVTLADELMNTYEAVQGIIKYLKI